MADLPITSLQEKTTPAVSGDFVVMIDSEDWNKVKKQQALQYKWPTWNTGATWSAWADWVDWTDWKTVLNGIVDPVSWDWVDWDFFFNTVSNTIFWPKTAWAWGSGTSLVWPTWATWSAGADWIDWTDWVDWTDWFSLLNWTSDPVAQWVDWDFYINTTSDEIFWPKTWGSWGTWTSLVWPTGATWPAWPTWAEGMIWTWPYDNWTAYVLDEWVSYNWSSYINIQAWTWNLPTDTAFWDIMASKWDSGAWTWDMLASNNLSDVADVPTARNNLSVESTTQLNARDTANRSRTNHTWAQDSSTVVPELKIWTPVHIDDLTSIISHIWSSTITDWGWLTDNWNWTVSIANWETTIRTVDTSHTPLYFATFSESLNLALTDNATNYVYLNYNAWTPIIAVTLDPTVINLTTKVPMYVIVREWNTISYLDVLDDWVDFVAKTRKRWFYTEKFIRGAWETWSVVSETGTRNLSVTAWEFYFWVKSYPHSAIDTSVTWTFEYYRLISWSWVESDETQLDNLQFNNISTPWSEVLQTLSSNKYAVHWIYLVNNNPSHFVVVYSQDEYNTFAEAEASTVPTTLPPSVEWLWELLGRFIILKSATSWTMESVFTTTFSSAQATTHNNLAWLQWWTASEYYHLTSAQHTIIWNTSWTNTGDQTIPDNTDFVDLTTAQSVLWVKTFSSSPVVPAPTTDLQVATKKYVDDNTTNIDETQLDTSVNTSLDLADSAVQPADAIPTARLTAWSLNAWMIASDHQTASIDQIVNVCYWTSWTPPTASWTTIWALYIQYTA